MTTEISVMYGSEKVKDVDRGSDIYTSLKNTFVMSRLKT